MGDRKKQFTREEIYMTNIFLKGSLKAWGRAGLFKLCTQIWGSY